MIAESIQDTRNLVFAALMTALIVVGAYIVVPVPGSPVPVVLQNFFVLITGLLLGWKWGLVSVALYLLLGAIGLPVFSAARGGIAHLVGPTGGYLIGFLPAVMLTGAISERTRSIPVLFVAGLGGVLSVYVFGVPWLMSSSSLSMPEAITVGLLPFLIPDIVKAGVAVAVARGVDATEILIAPGDAA